MAGGLPFPPLVPSQQQADPASVKKESKRKMMKPVLVGGLPLPPHPSSTEKQEGSPSPKETTPEALQPVIVGGLPFPPAPSTAQQQDASSMNATAANDQERKPLPEFHSSTSSTESGRVVAGYLTTETNGVGATSGTAEASSSTQAAPKRRGRKRKADDEEEGSAPQPQQPKRRRQQRPSPFSEEELERRRARKRCRTLWIVGASDKDKNRAMEVYLQGVGKMYEWMKTVSFSCSLYFTDPHEGLIHTLPTPTIPH